MAAYRRVYESRHLQADCQEPGSAPEPYARQLSMCYLYLFYLTSPVCSVEHTLAGPCRCTGANRHLDTPRALDEPSQSNTSARCHVATGINSCHCACAVTCASAQNPAVTSRLRFPVNVAAARNLFVVPTCADFSA